MGNVERGNETMLGLLIASNRVTLMNGEKLGSVYERDHNCQYFLWFSIL